MVNLCSVESVEDVRTCTDAYRSKNQLVIYSMTARGEELIKLMKETNRNAIAFLYRDDLSDLYDVAFYDFPVPVLYECSNLCWELIRTIFPSLTQSPM